jgi:glycosyltransferase involved in cell wall biosynthesis
MNLLLFNLATDADDPLLAFTTNWINRLALHYENIDVITMRAGRLTVAPNVRVFSVGKEKGYSEAKRSAIFYSILRRCLAERRYEAAFAHMMPLFALMAAPLLRARRIPITLWYAHRTPHWTVRYGMQACRRVVTSVPDAFPFRTPKLRVIGQGIDTDFFSPSSHPNPSPGGRGAKDGSHVNDLQLSESILPSPSQWGGVGGEGFLSVLHVARIMPIKHQSTLITAIADVPQLQAVFIGGVPPEQDSGYQDELEQLAASLNTSDRVVFAGAQLPEGVRDGYRSAFAAVNLSPVGLFDKAALEAMACAVPTIVSNAAFDHVLGEDAARLRTDSPDDITGLAVRLRDLLSLLPAEREAMGERLRRNVITQHSLDTLIPRLVSVINTGEMI